MARPRTIVRACCRFAASLDRPRARHAVTKQTGQNKHHAVLLIAKSAFAAAPHADMARLAGLVVERRPDAVVRYAFTEQGTPSFKDALLAFVDEGCTHVSIVPLILPRGRMAGHSPATALEKTCSPSTGKETSCRSWPKKQIEPETSPGRSP
jgi:hypothetical protein